MINIFQERNDFRCLTNICQHVEITIKKEIKSQFFKLNNVFRSLTWTSAHCNEQFKALHSKYV